jgi:hypothetical protein
LKIVNDLNETEKFKENAEKFEYREEEVIIFKIGEIRDLESLLN